MALGAGLPLLGRVYDPNLPERSSANGSLRGSWEFLGLVLLIYMGTLSILVWANFVPSIAILKLPFFVLQLIFCCVFVLALVGCVLVMVFMVELHKTFAGTSDPLIAAAGCFFFVSFVPGPACRNYPVPHGRGGGGAAQAHHRMDGHLQGPRVCHRVSHSLVIESSS